MKKPKADKTEQADPKTPAADQAEKVQIRRRRWFIAFAVLGTPLILLFGLEVVLRLAGFGYPTPFFIERRMEGRLRIIDNQEFGKRFFPPGLVRYPHPQSLPSPKPPGSLRIFVFGESAAMGDPDPRFGMSRMLEALLRARYPQRQVQVVNAAMVAINSHVILPVARDCARRDGDLWVVYMGNNEMIGPYGAISSFTAQTPPLGLIRASLAFKTTRMGQLFDALLLLRRRPDPRHEEWGGMAMWTNQQMRATDPHVRRSWGYFQRNLTDILNQGHSARIPVLLCTIPTNLRNCPPFGSLHGKDLTAADRAQWDSVYSQGVAAQDLGQVPKADAFYEQALKLDPEFAELCFRSAECALALGQTNRARQRFVEARDRDALQFRADSRISGIIRQTAAAHTGAGVRLLDAEKLFADASPQSTPGAEFFYEHVHLNTHGNYLLARALAEQVESMLGLRDGQATGVAQSAGNDKEKGDWLSQPDCLQAVSFTEANRQDVLERIIERMKAAPFTGQAHHDQMMHRLQQQFDQGRAATKPIQMQRAIRVLDQAVARNPDDPDLRWNLAHLMDVVDDPRAVEQWRAVIRLTPHAPLPYFTLGKLLESQNRAAEAIMSYKQCLQVQPEYFDARLALGRLLTAQGEMPEGIRQLLAAVRQRPSSPQGHLALGRALQRAGRAQEAERELSEAARLSGPRQEN